MTERNGAVTIRGAATTHIPAQFLVDFVHDVRTHLLPPGVPYPTRGACPHQVNGRCQLRNDGTRDVRVRLTRLTEDTRKSGMRELCSQAWRSSSNCKRCRSISSLSMFRSLSSRINLASIIAGPLELLSASACSAEAPTPEIADPPPPPTLLPLPRCAFGGGVRPIPRRLLQNRRKRRHAEATL